MSPAKSLRVVVGPEAVRAYATLNERQNRRDAWPFPWLFPPPNSKPVHAEGTAVAPAAATQVQILQYQVPAGMQFAFARVVQLYIGGGLVIGAGQLQWLLDVDQPLGVSALQGNPLNGLNNTQLPLGIYTPGGGFKPWEFANPYLLGPEQILRSKITTNGFAVGDPNYFVTIFEGWTWPAAG